MKRKPGEVDDETRVEPLVTRTMESGEQQPSAAGLPASIGEYRVLSKLGEGGMGVVYEAEQASLNRRVALKVIRGGAAVDEHRLRMFEREAETLARLEHPGIGAIHEAARSAEGQPFLVMERVGGQPLDEYLSARGTVASREEIEFRLRLFLKLCAAVSYAHQRGVIHRDLKPANIMVDCPEEGEEPMLKVLDFGLARIIDENSPSATMATEVGTIKGTLYYMSPEQARGDTHAVDIRSDVYALGVILFEMLTGARPLEFSSHSIVEAVRTICDDPPRNLRQAWTAPQRPDEDLETILGKALEKDAERRYSGVAVIADDIVRYLDSRPITARPPSSVYLLKKFAHRNRVLVGGVAATAVMLVVGVVVSTMFALGEARQRKQAEAARDDLEAVVNFQSNMIGEVDPQETGQRILSALRERIVESQPAGDSLQQRLADLDRAVVDVNPTDLARDILEQNILEPAASAAASGFEGKPLIEARLQQSIGSTYRGLGLYDAALPHVERAVELFGDELGRNDMSAIVAERELALVQWDRGEREKAETLFVDLVTRLSETNGPDERATLVVRSELAGLRSSLGRDEDESEYLEILAALKRVAGDDDPAPASVMDKLGVIYYQQGRYDDALPMWTEALAVYRRVAGPDSSEALKMMRNLATLNGERGDTEGANALLEEVLGIQKRIFGDDDPRTMSTEGSLALLYRSQGLIDRAIELHRTTLAKKVKVLGKSHVATQRSMNNLALALMSKHEYPEARRLLEELVLLSATGEADGRNRAVNLHTLGELYMATGDLPAAEPALREALEFYERASHKYAGLALYQLGGISAQQGRSREAISYLSRALASGYKQFDANAAEFESLREDPRFKELVAREGAVK